MKDEDYPGYGWEREMEKQEAWEFIHVLLPITGIILLGCVIGAFVARYFVGHW